MASDLGVSISIVSAWENATRFPSAERLQEIAKYTGIPICEFFYSGPEECPQSKAFSMSSPG